MRMSLKTAEARVIISRSYLCVCVSVYVCVLTGVELGVSYIYSQCFATKPQPQPSELLMNEKSDALEVDGMCLRPLGAEYS